MLVAISAIGALAHIGRRKRTSKSPPNGISCKRALEQRVHDVARAHLSVLAQFFALEPVARGGVTQWQIDARLYRPWIDEFNAAILEISQHQFSFMLSAGCKPSGALRLGEPPNKPPKQSAAGEESHVRPAPETVPNPEFLDRVVLIDHAIHRGAPANPIGCPGEDLSRCRLESVAARDCPPIVIDSFDMRCEIGRMVAVNFDGPLKRQLETRQKPSRKNWVHGRAVIPLDGFRAQRRPHLRPFRSHPCSIFIEYSQ